MKVAIIQFKASTSKKTNLEKIISFIADAASKGAVMCAFPEFMMFYTISDQSPKQLSDLSETINGSFVRSIARAAKDNHIQVIGSFYEKSRKQDRVYDTTFIINDSGTVISTYRKIHLYDALGFRESDKMVRGSKITKPAKVERLYLQSRINICSSIVK